VTQFFDFRRRWRMAILLVAALAALALAVYSPASAADLAQSQDRLTYVLLPQGKQDSTMSGSMDDLRRARALRAGSDGLFYLREQRAAYVIRDAATVRQAEAILRPQAALGARQAELGSRQAALGSRQAALGAQQARLGGQYAKASSQRQEELGHEQQALGRQQEALAGQQDALGRQQNAYARQQERLALEANAKILALLADARRRGLAHRVN
jgi:bla regulator protein BlaR1